MQFNGRKCDNCGKEDRNQVKELNEILDDRMPNETAKGAMNAMTPGIAAAPWMRVWWRKDYDFCPDCAPLVEAAVTFARRLVRK